MSPYKEKVRARYRKERAKGYRACDAARIAKAYARYEKGAKCPFDNKWGYEGKEERELPNGWKLVFELQYDSDCGPPWKEFDGHGEVEWVHRHLEEWERNWVLSWDGSSKLLYDFDASLAKAKREGWGPGTPYEAVKADFDYLYGYCNDEWCYVGIIVRLEDEQGKEIDEDSCWGFESNDVEYLTREARSWAAHMLKKHYPRYWDRHDRQREFEFEEAA